MSSAPHGHDGGTCPTSTYRSSFTNLQSVAAMCEGGMVADLIAAVASIDPVMGGGTGDSHPVSRCSIRLDTGRTQLQFVVEGAPRSYPP